MLLQFIETISWVSIFLSVCIVSHSLFTCQLALGRSNKWLLSQLNWLNTNTNYENAMQNSIYKLINSENDHNFKQYLIKNRSIRMHAENKVGTHDQTMGHSVHTQKSFLYRSIAIYNKLPKTVTLSTSRSMFKNRCKKYNLNNSVKLRDLDYNNKPRERFLIDLTSINNCQNSGIM